MSEWIVADTNYLQHHGILGQKWGHRNGPPYPLDDEDHSAREKRLMNKANRLERRSDRLEKKSAKNEVRSGRLLRAGNETGAGRLLMKSGKQRSKANKLDARAEKIRNKADELTNDRLEREKEEKQNNPLNLDKKDVIREDKIVKTLDKNEAALFNDAKNAFNKYVEQAPELLYSVFDNGVYDELEEEVKKNFGGEWTGDGAELYWEIEKLAKTKTDEASKKFVEDSQKYDDLMYEAEHAYSEADGKIKSSDAKNFVWYLFDKALVEADNRKEEAHSTSIKRINHSDLVSEGEAFLEHHGILGQKWGHRNGPPYPLDPEDHSASERKAGWRQSLADYSAKQKEKYEERERQKLDKIISTGDIKGANRNANKLTNKEIEDTMNRYLTKQRLSSLNTVEIERTKAKLAAKKAERQKKRDEAAAKKEKENQSKDNQQVKPEVKKKTFEETVRGISNKGKAATDLVKTGIDVWNTTAKITNSLAGTNLRTIDIGDKKTNVKKSISEEYVDGILKKKIVTTDRDGNKNIRTDSYTQQVAEAVAEVVSSKIDDIKEENVNAGKRIFNDYDFYWSGNANDPIYADFKEVSNDYLLEDKKRK